MDLSHSSASGVKSTHSPQSVKVWGETQVLCHHGDALAARGTRRVVFLEAWNMNLWAVDHGDGQEGWFEIAGLGGNWLSQSRIRSLVGASFVYLLKLKCKLVKRRE